MTSVSAQYQVAMQNHVWKMNGALLLRLIATMTGTGSVNNVKTPYCTCSAGVHGESVESYSQR